MFAAALICMVGFSLETEAPVAGQLTILAGAFLLGREARRAFLYFRYGDQGQAVAGGLAQRIMIVSVFLLLVALALAGYGIVAMITVLVGG